MARVARHPQNAALRKLARRRKALVAAVDRFGAAAAKANGRLARAERELARFDDTVNSLVAATGSTADAATSPRRGRPPKSDSGKRRGPSQREALITVLGETDGLGVTDAVAAIRERFGMDIRRGSASTVLSMLKRQGRVVNKNGIWRVADGPAGTTDQ